MARVTQPLYGSSASGSLGELMTFTNQWETAVVRSYRTTPVAVSVDQAAQRALFAAAVLLWRLLDLPAQDQWAARAPAPLTGYNLFIFATLTGKTLADFSPHHSYYGVILLGSLEYGWDD